MGAPGMYPNMSHSRREPANSHSNKFHKLTICNYAHMFMVSQYRITMGIENKNWRLYASFWFIIQMYLLKKFVENIWAFILKHQNLARIFSA